MTMAESEVKIRTESGLNFLARVTPRASLCGLEPAVFGDAGPLPETAYLLCGESGTGKTLILTQWIAKCILPPKFKDRNLEGLGASILLINTEHSFSLLRLVALLETRIKQSLRAKRARDTADAQNFTFTSKDVETLREEALSRLQIITCFSSHEVKTLLAGLQALITLKPISLIIWDSLATFYWEDRLLSQRRLATYCRNLVKTLLTVTKSAKICVITSCQAITWNWEEVAGDLQDLLTASILFSKTSHTDFSLKVTANAPVAFKIRNNVVTFQK